MGGRDGFTGAARPRRRRVARWLRARVDDVIEDGGLILCAALFAGLIAFGIWSDRSDAEDSDSGASGSGTGSGHQPPSQHWQPPPQPAQPPQFHGSYGYGSVTGGRR
ncbi:hypothetical protein [Allonocardiopsis opalescens]|uniref:Uncharacterized protein n=1 Tax=Allonocardiopsis opalescens TaxID=1144618 RepID=A0A2T0QAS6_9ACTN|nr:hypothetical protein [Allonocardiopsis opalescens]PRY00979.1 hypothetical protein CLV72_102612 [Allonocardiopsis opalescens]